MVLFLFSLSFWRDKLDTLVSFPLRCVYFISVGKLYHLDVGFYCRYIESYNNLLRYELCKRKLILLIESVRLSCY